MVSPRRLMTSIFLVVAMATTEEALDEDAKACREPDLHTLALNMPRAAPDGLEFDSSYLNLPDIPTQLNLYTRYGPLWSSFRRTAYVSGPRDCHLEGLGPPLCPTYYVIDYDVDRVPRVLFHARCTCRQCRHVPQGICQPVQIFRHVLRRAGCAHGVYVYRAVWEPLPVTCKCELPLFQPQTSPSEPPSEGGR